MKLIIFLGIFFTSNFGFSNNLIEQTYESTDYQTLYLYSNCSDVDSTGTNYYEYQIYWTPSSAYDYTPSSDDIFDNVSVIPEGETYYFYNDSDGYTYQIVFNSGTPTIIEYNTCDSSGASTLYLYSNCSDVDSTGTNYYEYQIYWTPSSAYDYTPSSDDIFDNVSVIPEGETYYFYNDSDGYTYQIVFNSGTPTIIEYNTCDSSGASTLYLYSNCSDVDSTGTNYYEYQIYWTPSSAYDYTPSSDDIFDNVSVIPEGDLLFL